MVSPSSISVELWMLAPKAKSPMQQNVITISLRRLQFSGRRFCVKASWCSRAIQSTTARAITQSNKCHCDKFYLSYYNNLVSYTLQVDKPYKRDIKSALRHAGIERQLSLNAAALFEMIHSETSFRWCMTEMNYASSVSMASSSTRIVLCLWMGFLESADGLFRFLGQNRINCTWKRLVV